MMLALFLSVIIRNYYFIVNRIATCKLIVTQYSVKRINDSKVKGKLHAEADKMTYKTCVQMSNQEWLAENK